MSNLYITTSRKPKNSTRKLVKWLAILMKAKKENRGKRDFGEIEERAKTFGCPNLLFIYERHGNPDSLNFYRKNWLGQIKIKKIEFNKLPKRGEVELVVPEKIEEIIKKIRSLNYSTHKKNEIVFKSRGTELLKIILGD